MMCSCDNSRNVIKIEERGGGGRMVVCFVKNLQALLFELLFTLIF